MAYLLDKMEAKKMTDIYERMADENEPAPATAPAAQLTGDQASELMPSLMAEDSDATAILAALAGPGRPAADEKRESRACRNASASRPHVAPI